ncbi:MAG: zinc ribbon domain-containing protein [Dehalococcoidia bacterium]|nr:zinc ribbon domain-containing protein [Dehalococcoidia bacterium]
MKCSKCGAEVPEGSGFCGSCGSPVGGAKSETQFSQWWTSTSALIARDPAVILVGLGAVLLCLGTFLSWIDMGRFEDTLGLQMAAGPVVLALGAMLVLCLVLARGGTPGAWSIVILVLSAVCLVLIFQTMVFLSDHERDVGAGLYVSMVGGLAAAIGGLLETMRILKK